MMKILTFIFLFFVGVNAFSQISDDDSYPVGMMFGPTFSVDSIAFCGELLPLEDPVIRERFEREVLLMTWDKPQMILWLKRTMRYFPVIESILEQAHLPDDIKYLAVIESALQPHAYSTANAVGFWQFIQSTGQKYGLRIDEEVDERRNITFSTWAAARYFNALYDSLGSWTLAAAAYNMGETGLLTEILVQGNSDYYALNLPLETQRFVLKILVVKLVLLHPDQFGVFMKPEDYYTVESSDRVVLQNETRLPIQLVACAAKTTFETIKILNPELVGYTIPPGEYMLNVPLGTVTDFHAQLDSVLTVWKKWQSNNYYIVQAGDSLEGIAKQFRVTQQAIMIWNDLSRPTLIKPGQVLIVTPFDVL